MSTPTMLMTADELKAEIASHYERASEIENKYPGALTREVNADDYAKVKAELSTVDKLEDLLKGVEESDERKARYAENLARLRKPTVPHIQPSGDPSRNGGSPGSIKMFGQQFVESEEYKRILESGVLNNPANRVEFGVKLEGSLLDALMGKALVYGGSGVAGPLIRPERIPGLDFLWRDTSFLDMIPTGTVSVNAIEYYEMTLSQNNAAFVAEATATTGTTGLKPEGAIAWTLRSAPVSTLAEWIPATLQMLADAPFMEGLIRQQLLTHLQLALETGIISGNGVAPNPLGLLSNPNIQTIGLGAGSGTAIDAIYHAMTAVMVTGLANPTASVWNPLDFEGIRLAREATAGTTGLLGGYLMGPPNLTGPTTLWGRPTVMSLGMPAKTAVTADFQRAVMLFDREQAAIRTGTINDQFVRNMQTILAELRACFVTFRPLAVCRVTGLP
jgi:HK97 family phage major capsid protein